MTPIASPRDSARRPARARRVRRHAGEATPVPAPAAGLQPGGVLRRRRRGSPGGTTSASPRSAATSTRGRWPACTGCGPRPAAWAATSSTTSRARASRPNEREMTMRAQVAHTRAPVAEKQGEPPPARRTSRSSPSARRRRLPTAPWRRRRGGLIRGDDMSRGLIAALGGADRRAAHCLALARSPSRRGPPDGLAARRLEEWRKGRVSRST